MQTVSALELDWPQHDHPTACVNVEHYPSTTVISVCCLSFKKKFGMHW